MSTFEKIAEGSSDICVGALALLWGDPSGTATVAAGLAGLGILGLSLRRGCAETAGRTAAARTIAALKASPEFAGADLTRAEALLADRPSHATLTPHTLVEAAKAPTDAARTEALAEALYARIPFDGDDARTKRLLRLALQSAMRACYENPELQTRITREVLIDTARQTDGAVEILERVEDATGRIEGKLDKTPEKVSQQVIEDLRKLGFLRNLPEEASVSLTDLQNLAHDFGEGAPRTVPEIMIFLRSKAEDIARLSREVVKLKGLSDKVDNIAGAAAEAIDRRDLDEARRLLDSGREVQADLLRKPLETNAALMEKTAEIDLIEGRADQAFRILSAAADSFAAVDPLEPARRRYEYEDRLYSHGLRYGGNALARASKMLRASAMDGLRQADPLLWAKVQNNLALSLQAQGCRTGGPEGAALLAEAVAAYDEALTVYTRNEHPVDWAAIQCNLVAALQEHGTRTGGPEGAALLAKSVAASGQALAIFTSTDHPVHWATAQMNLANALQEQGTRTGGPEGSALMTEAVAAYGEALTVYTRDDHPVDWARTQNNLASALRNQSTHTEGPEGAVLLAKAVTAYRQALTVRTRENHPMDWAGTQNNLAIALTDQGTRNGGPEGAALLDEAAAAYGKALSAYTRDDHPVDWARTQNNLCIALMEQGIRTGGPEGSAMLAQAVAASGEALTIRTREHHPVDWAMTKENMAIAEEALADHDTTTDPTPHLRAALEHIEAALTVYDPEHMPERHREATALRDRIRARLAP